MILVIVPTYNESENIERILARLFATLPDAHALVVDDGSPDGTGKIADTLADADDRVHVLHRTAKAGLGAAYVAGFDWGLARDYDVLVEMDADGSHAPEQLPRLLAALDSADMVLGSRWVPGGAIMNWPRRREVLSRGGNLYVRMALGVDLRDATGGYRAYRREVLERIEYTAATSQGYCFRVVEVPITFAERERGESKMNSAIVREALTRVTGWGLAHRATQARALLRRGR
jgi:dolichol-phosphate mannosyltransferase